MKKIIVLGGYGEMGTVITTDLAETAKDCQIVIAGRDKQKAKALADSLNKKNITFAEANISDKTQTEEVIEGADVLVNATNYYNNLQVMEKALTHNVNYVDLGGLYHMTLKQLKLTERFEKNGLVAMIGCGSTPGITNVMVDYASRMLDRVDTVDIQFGDGDSTKYNTPFVVPYSMYTVFDEFTKDAAVFRNEKVDFVPSLSGGQEIEFPSPVGKLKCYYSLHSELATIPKTLSKKGIKECSFRGGWPSSFISQMKFLIDTGMASDEPIKIDGREVKPRDVTVRLLNRFLPPKDVLIDDIEFLRVDISGAKKGKRTRVIMNCKTTTNKKWNIPAGSWDTGVPPSIFAQMIIHGDIKGTGVMAPDCGCVNVDKFFSELEKRGIKTYIEQEHRV